ncbi:cuticle protein 16.8-like [Dermacentor albipictus]|uniref:cuticle protein 16.8-like n=1 Tax=Dermacentor albipictus TaxID=60249 RepID=UPI0031FCE818
MDTILKTVLLLSVTALASAGNVFGGGHHGFSGAGFRGAGFQSGGFGGPLFAAAATPGLSGGGASYPPQPYSFGYDTTDEFGTQLFHKEQGDASNAKTGSYGYRDANGIFRTVKYVADANGFRATIDTNEPGTAPGASADAVFNANPVAAPAVGPGAGKGGAGRYAGAKAGAYGAGAGGPWAG